MTIGVKRNVTSKRRRFIRRPAATTRNRARIGIQPNIVQLIRDALLKLNKEQGMTIILVEQKLPFARAVGEEFILMEKGQVISSWPMTELTDELVGKYLTV